MEHKILNIPSMSIFNNNWDLLLKFMENEGNPPFSIDGNLNLSFIDIETLGNLVSVGGSLDLRNNYNFTGFTNLISVGGNLDLEQTNIETLGSLVTVGGTLYLEESKIESLGELDSVEGSLILSNTSISSLGKLKYVGGNFYLKYTHNLNMSIDQIRQQVEIVGAIYGKY